MPYMIFLLKSAVHVGSRKPCSRCPCTAINVLFSNLEPFWYVPYFPRPLFSQDRTRHPSQVWKDLHAHEAQASCLGGGLQGGNAGQARFATAPAYVSCLGGGLQGGNAGHQTGA